MKVEHFWGEDILNCNRQKLSEIRTRIKSNRRMSSKYNLRLRPIVHNQITSIPKNPNRPKSNDADPEWTPRKGKTNRKSKTRKWKTDSTNKSEEHGTLNLITDFVDTECICPICQQLLSQATTLNCGHIYCGICINEWSKRSSICPTCRAEVISKSPLLIIQKLISLHNEIKRIHERKRNVRKKKASGIFEF